MARKGIERVYGPYPGKIIGGHRCWRLVHVDGNGERRTVNFTGEGAKDEADAAAKEARERLTGRKVSEAIDAYVADLAENGNRSSSLESTRCRLRTFFQIGTGNGGLLSDVTPARARKMLELAKVRRHLVWVRGGHAGRKKVEQREVERPRSVTYRAGMLAEAQSFAAWCCDRGWLLRDKDKATPLDGLAVKGKRRRGKPQIKKREFPKWERVALARADAGNLRSFAAVLTFYLGDRAGETLALTPDHVDLDGAEILIGESKTEAGEDRTLEVPSHLRPRLVAACRGKRRDERIFGGISVDMLRREVEAICTAAGLRRMTTQGLRGLHASIAREIGLSGSVIARQLGHADSGQTADAHYAVPGSRQRGEARKVAERVEALN